MDKAFWRSIADNEFAVPDDHTAAELAEELLGYLGSTDPELRDEYAYGITARWMNRQILTPDDYATWVDPMAANLQQGLGEQDTDAVFLRSFSALILAALVYCDNHRQQYLSDEQFHTLLDQTLTYFAAECDLRGFVPEKGWAHAIAHTADLFDEFAISRYAQPADLERILTVFGDKVMARTGVVFLYNEDDRMTYAVLSALKREILSREWIVAWLDQLGGIVDQVDRSTRLSDPAHHSAYLNTKNFLRSLTIRLLADDLPEAVRTLADDARAALLKLE